MIPLYLQAVHEVHSEGLLDRGRTIRLLRRWVDMGVLFGGDCDPSHGMFAEVRPPCPPSRLVFLYFVVKKMSPRSQTPWGPSWSRHTQPVLSLSSAYPVLHPSLLPFIPPISPFPPSPRSKPFSTSAGWTWRTRSTLVWRPPCPREETGSTHRTHRDSVQLQVRREGGRGGEGRRERTEHFYHRRPRTKNGENACKVTI